MKIKVIGYAVFNRLGKICDNVDPEFGRYISSAIFCGKNLSESKALAELWIKDSFLGDPRKVAVKKVYITLK